MAGGPVRHDAPDRGDRVPGGQSEDGAEAAEGQPAGDRLRQRQSHRGREPGGHGHLQRHGPAGRQGDDQPWEHLTFTADPLASTLAKSAKDAEEVGLLEPVRLKGIYALAPLNKILEAEGRPTVSSSLTIKTEKVAG